MKIWAVIFGLLFASIGLALPAYAANDQCFVTSGTPNMGTGWQNLPCMPHGVAVVITGSSGVTQDVNLQQVNGGTTSAFNSGVVGAQTQRVTLATDVNVPANVAQVGGSAIAIGTGTNATSLPVVLPSDGTLPLPSGASTSAQIGEVQASPTSNTVLDRLKTINTSITAATISTITNADAQVLTSSLKVGSQNLVYNGTTYDLLRGAANSTNSTGTGIGAAAGLFQCDDTSPTAITENSFGNRRGSCVDHSALAGAIAQSSERTAATTATVTALATDLVGKLIVLPYANPENFVSGLTAAMTGTTTTSLIASPGGSLRNYVTQLICTNSHATVGTFVIVQDGSGGTTFYEGYAAAVGGGFSISFPVPLRQPTAATAVFVADVTTGANVICSGSGYKGL